MHKIKEVLRLYLLGGVTSCRRIGRATGCGKTAVAECLRRAAAAGLRRWDDVAALDEELLEQRLYPGEVKRPEHPVRPQPDWVRIREELSRRDHHVTLALLWQEYKAEQPEGYQYSQFAELYRRFEKRLSVVFRQTHRPGEKCFVDFCDGIALTDPLSGAAIPTQLFVGALGASSYTFAMATLSQELPVWLDCHVRMYEFFGGVSALTIPDNLRSGVKRADRYEAELNPSYRELASHYGTCVIPARIKKPRDKAKVEAAVLVAQRWILAALRHRTFYHLNEMNAAIAGLLVKLNERVMRHLKESRRSLYERLDRPALKPLPATAYAYAEWKQVKLNIDYHAVFDDHFYSAPYTLIGEVLWCRATSGTIELFHKGKRVASHPRSYVKYAYSTLPEHRPASHRAHLEWTPSRLIDWGKSIGLATGALIEHVIRSKPHPEQGYRSALGILRLSGKHGAQRLERACEKAFAIHSPSYKTIKTMLEQRMEGVPLRGEASRRSADEDGLADALGAANVRGSNYYH
jgi:transposase